MQEIDIMPKKGERARKIRVLRSGGTVKAPKKYWDKMMKELKKEYPKMSLSRLSRIAGTRWRDISRPVKIRLVKEYQR